MKTSAKRKPTPPTVTQAARAAAGIEHETAAEPITTPPITPEQAGEIAAGIWMSATPEFTPGPTVFSSPEWLALCRRQYELFTQWKATKPLAAPQFKNEVGEPFHDLVDSFLVLANKQEGIPEDTPEWNAACEVYNVKLQEIFDAANSLAMEAFDAGIREGERRTTVDAPPVVPVSPAPALRHAVPTCEGNDTFTHALSVLGGKETAFSRAPETGPEADAAFYAADNARESVFLIVDTMLSNAYQLGAQDALAAASVPAPTVQAEPAPITPEVAPMDLPAFMYETLQETGFHDNLTAAMVAAGNQSLYYRDNVRTLADEGKPGYQAQEALLSAVRKSVNASAKQFGLQMFLAGQQNPQ